MLCILQPHLCAGMQKTEAQLRRPPGYHVHAFVLRHFVSIASIISFLQDQTPSMRDKSCPNTARSRTPSQPSQPTSATLHCLLSAVPTRKTHLAFDPADFPSPRISSAEADCRKHQHHASGDHPRRQSRADHFLTDKRRCLVRGSDLLRLPVFAGFTRLAFRLLRR